MLLMTNPNKHMIEWYFGKSGEFFICVIPTYEIIKVVLEQITPKPNSNIWSFYFDISAGHRLEISSNLLGVYPEKQLNQLFIAPPELFIDENFDELLKRICKYIRNDYYVG